MRLTAIAAASLGFALSFCVIAADPPLLTAPIQYPESPRGEVVDDYHGNKVADPYRWLEDLDAPKTTAWVEAQNALSLPFLAALPERQPFQKRLTQLWNYERFDVPAKAAGHYFYLRNDGLQNQAVLYVQAGALAVPRVLLDPNGLSNDGTVALTQFEPSPDGRWVVYGTANAGSDWNDFHIREVATGKDAAETLGRIKFSDAQWTADSKGFFYSRYPDPPESLTDSGSRGGVFDGLADQKLYYHRVGTPQSEDPLVFELPEQPRWFVSGEVTDDGRYLVVSLHEGSAEECRLYVLDLVDPQQPKFDGPLLKLVDDFRDAHRLVGSRGQTLYLRTTRDAPRQRIVAVDLQHPDQWQSIVAESTDTIADAGMAAGRLVVSRLHDASSRLWLYGLQGKVIGMLPLPGLGTVASTITGAPDDDELLIGFSSYKQPLTPYRVSLKRLQVTPFRPLKLGFAPADYVTEQVFYSSADGTRVPMFISYKKGYRRNGQARVLLHGYGGFDIAKTPSFDVSALAWMERGGVYAVANLRGGGEYGEAWHEAGTRERKQNVFDDFAAAARYLVAKQYTQAARIAIWGRSNGGLLVGASINQHPELWGAAVASVGVMDMLRFHRFTVGYAWTGDYGSSDDPEGFAYLSKYSPLHTLTPGQAYPPTLITTGDHDDRVHPAHSYKYAAALQSAQGGEAPVLIRIDTRAGHGAGKPVNKIIEEEADKLAFLWHYTEGHSGGPR